MKCNIFFRNHHHHQQANRHEISLCVWVTKLHKHDRHQWMSPLVVTVWKHWYNIECRLPHTIDRPRPFNILSVASRSSSSLRCYLATVRLFPLQCLPSSKYHWHRMAHKSTLFLITLLALKSFGWRWW